MIFSTESGSIQPLNGSQRASKVANAGILHASALLLYEPHLRDSYCESDSAERISGSEKAFWADVGGLDAFSSPVATLSSMFPDGDHCL
jgi:hypothetical protein